MCVTLGCVLDVIAAWLSFALSSVKDASCVVLFGRGVLRDISTCIGWQICVGGDNQLDTSVFCGSCLHGRCVGRNVNQI